MAALAVLAAAVLWGTVGAAQELGAPEASPAAVAAVRSLGGGLLLVASVLLARRGAQLTAVLRAAPGLATGAIVAISVFQLGYLAGIRVGGVAVGTLLGIGSAPMFAGLLSQLRGRPPGGRWMVATVATIVGAGALLLGGGEAGTTPLGAGLSLMAGAAYASYTVLAKQLLDRGLAGPSVMAVIFTGAGLLLLPVLVVTGGGWLLSSRGALTALWLGVAGTLLGYRLFARGLAGVDAATATTLTLAEPLTAALLGTVLLAERLTGWALVGAGLLAVGLVLAAVPGGPARLDRRRNAHDHDRAGSRGDQRHGDRPRR